MWKWLELIIHCTTEHAAISDVSFAAWKENGGVSTHSLLSFSVSWVLECFQELLKQIYGFAAAKTDDILPYFLYAHNY